MDKKLMKRSVHYLFLLVTLIMLASGLGITEYRTVEIITFGLLDKPLAFQLHSSLWLVFTLLLVLHIYLSVFSRK